MAKTVDVVIQLKEFVYEAICNNKNPLCCKEAIEMTDAIRNGKVLPKGHGNLKDFDKIEWYGCDFEGRGCIEAKGDCSVCNHANCYAKQVRELPTIIEADKEGAEE